MNRKRQANNERFKNRIEMEERLEKKPKATKKQRAAERKAKASKPLVAISLDIEADGPSPVTNSCLQLGFVVFRVCGGRDVVPPPVPGGHSWLVEQRGWCLEPQPGRVVEKRCMDEFWSKNAEQLAYIRANAMPAPAVMAEFAAWYAGLLDKYRIQFWVAKPASYDAQWLNGLYEEFQPKIESSSSATQQRPKLPFSFVCISTMYKVASLLGIHPTVSHDASLPHTHDAVADAAGQAFHFLALEAAFREASAKLAKPLDSPARVETRVLRDSEDVDVDAAEDSSASEVPITESMVLHLRI